MIWSSQGAGLYVPGSLPLVWDVNAAAAAGGGPAATPGGGHTVPVIRRPRIRVRSVEFDAQTLLSMGVIVPVEADPVTMTLAVPVFLDWLLEVDGMALGLSVKDIAALDEDLLDLL